MAAISASELNVILQARDKEFTKAMDRAQRRVERFAKQSGKGLSNTTRSFDMLSSAASKLGLAFSAGAVFTGFSALINNATQSAKALQNLANLAGVNVERFQEMSFASQSVGLEQDKLADILKDVNDKFGDYLATGAGPLADFFENIAPKVGITAKAFQGLSSDQALGLYVKTLQEAGVNQQELTFYMEALASDATALAPLFLNNASSLEEFAQAARDAGAVLDTDLIDKSADMRRRFEEVITVMETRLTNFALLAVDAFDSIFDVSESAQLESLGKQFDVIQRKIEATNAEIDALEANRGTPFFNQTLLQEAIDALTEQEIISAGIQGQMDGINDNLVKRIELEERLKKNAEGGGTNTGPIDPDKIKEATKALKNFEDTLDDIDKISNTLEQGLEDVFMSALDGAKSFEDQVKLTMQAVIRELYRVLVVQQLVNAAMGFFGGPSAGFLGLPFGKASGGPVNPGQPYTVGEHGREIFVPSSAGRILSVPQSKDAISGGGDVVINQTINVTTGVQQTVRAEIKSLMPQIAESAKGAVADAKMRGGQYKRAFS